MYHPQAMLSTPALWTTLTFLAPRCVVRSHRASNDPARKLNVVGPLRFKRPVVGHLQTQAGSLPLAIRADCAVSI
jgi:hypothetical protein